VNLGQQLAGLALNQVAGAGKLILDKDPAALVKAKSLCWIGVDQVVAVAVGQEELKVARQIGGERGKDAIEVDIDHHCTDRAAHVIRHRCGQDDGGLVQPGVRAAFVVDDDAREVGGARRQLECARDVGEMRLFLQVVAAHAQHTVTGAVHAHPLQPVVAGRYQPDLEV